MKKFLSFTFCLLILTCSLFTLDFGLVLDQSAEYGGSGSDSAFGYKGILIPKVSGLLGESGGFYISAGANYEFDPLDILPELLRTDLYLHNGNLEFRLGRMQYQDPLGYIATGLFDGARLSFDSEAGTFSAGGWYTGFLNKIRANIEMTNKEQEQNATALDYSDFTNTYFAPRRVLSALEWEHQGLGERIPAKLSLLGQFDLGDKPLHSQYLAGKMSIPAGSLVFDLGGCLEFLQVSGDSSSAFAAEAGITWRMSAQQFALLGRYSSGNDGSITAFQPLTTVSQGYILKPKLSGLSLISLDYTARLQRTLSIGISTLYFIRSNISSGDSDSYPFYGNDGHLLGAEFYAGLYWAPVSDMMINLGGGAFMPSLGNVAPEAERLWRFEANVIISFF